MTTLAGRRTPERILPADAYVCRRCGIVRYFNHARTGTRPTLCRDCQDVTNARAS